MMRLSTRCFFGILGVPENTFQEGRPRSDTLWETPSWKIAAHQIMERMCILRRTEEDEH